MNTIFGTLTWDQRSLLALLCVMSVITSSCSGKRNSEVDAPVNSASESYVDATNVTNIVLSFVRTNEGWTNAIVLHLTTNDRGWKVIVVRNPARAGSHCSMEVDKHGNITNYSAGL
jgi:hypothetical protein